jgi:hypothetical protein
VNERELDLRITVVDPPAGVMFAMQRGRAELDQATRSTGATIAFDFTVRVRTGPSGALNFLGQFTQGPPRERFVYVIMGARAGDGGSPWSRRAKIPLRGITLQLVAALDVTPDAILEARYAGTGKDGGPTCASVTLLDDGWRVVDRRGPTRARARSSASGALG